MPTYSRWQSKPWPGTPLDPAQGLAKGLVGLWPFNEGSGIPIDAVSGRAATSNTLVWAKSTRGPVLSNPTGTAIYTQVNVPAGSPLDVTGKGISYGTWVQPGSSAGFQFVMGLMTTTRQYSLFLHGTGAVNVVLNGVINADMALSVHYVPGAWNLIIITYDGATVSAYVNGVLSSTSAGSAAITHVAGASLYMGYDVPDAALPFTGQIDAPGVWNRTLSAGEVAALYQNPWQAFQPQRAYWLKRNLISYVLSASPGSYSLSGHAANLTAARLLSGSPGSYSLSGHSASLLANRVLTASPGAYATSGHAASLLANRVLLASPGSYSMTGSPATLTAGFYAPDRFDPDAATLVILTTPDLGLAEFDPDLATLAL